MHSSLSWIEWLERLDRVLASARQDVQALSRWFSPRSVAAVERSTRQLAALTDNLRFLDRTVVSAQPTESSPAEDLQRALDTTVFHLGTVTEVRESSSPAFRDRVLSAIDAALRDSCYEAANLLGPRRRQA